MSPRRPAVLAMFALAGCGEPAQPVNIEFRAVAGETVIACSGTEPALTDLRLFVSDVALIDKDGSAVPLTLDAAAPWQNAQVALVDLEDGSGACDTGSPQQHRAVTGKVAAGTYRGLRFTVGVPFALNHANPALAAAPLDQTVMHWHWQAGYKFLRAGLSQDGRSAWGHVGSTGCRGRIGDIDSCDRPNRVAVALADFDAAADAVAIDVRRLFQGILAEGDPATCMGEIENPVCQALAANLAADGAFSRARR